MLRHLSHMTKNIKKKETDDQTWGVSSLKKNQYYAKRSGSSTIARLSAYVSMEATL